MGLPRVISKTQHFDFNRESVHKDARMKFLLIKDTISNKGFNLFKTLLKSYADKDVDIALLCCDSSVKDLTSGMQVNQDKIYIIDDFSESSSWDTKQSNFDCHIEKLKDFEGLFCIYSLTSLMIQSNVDKVYRTIYKLMNDKPAIHILALLHSDVHSKEEIEIITSLSTTAINVGPREDHFLMTITSRNKSYGQFLYEYKLASFDFQTISVITQNEKKAPTKKPDPTANLTFNLNLNAGEIEARSQLQLPFTKNVNEESVVSQDLEDFYEEEDPDDDLGFLEAV